MPKPDIPVGTAKIDVTGTVGGTTWANVFYAAVGTFDPAHLEDVIDLLAKAYKGFYDACFGTGAFPTAWQLTLYRILFRDASDSHYKSVRAGDVTGSSPDEAMPSNAAVLVDWVTNDPRKGGKPRQYVCGVTDQWLADSANLVAATVSATNTAIATWLASLATLSSGTASGVQPLEMSFRDAKAWRTDAATWPIRGGHVVPVICTQRRRTDRLLP